MNPFRLFLFFTIFATGPAKAAPYFVSQEDYETRPEKSTLRAWPLNFVKSSAGYFLDEEKVFLSRAVVVKPVKKISALCYDRNVWVAGTWVDITEPSPPLTPSEWF